MRALCKGIGVGPSSAGEAPWLQIEDRRLQIATPPWWSVRLLQPVSDRATAGRGEDAGPNESVVVAGL